MYIAHKPIWQFKNINALMVMLNDNREQMRYGKKLLDEMIEIDPADSSIREMAQNLQRIDREYGELIERIEKLTPPPQEYDS